MDSTITLKWISSAMMAGMNQSKSNRLGSGWPGSACWEDENIEGQKWKEKPQNGRRCRVVLYTGV